ncbi:alpha/beta fold hydrolase [Arcanobacterium hippocoleae]|uniref:Pimeloyl-ACP methyl ester carboxylesterase n=1 Tax=Arcanobacterium hippocoleae TaxID=149017 RepID=A0ABU1T2K2_9ACTO|nr:alpha/beta fold hydrolase [Arcanobacterium hippocoleae]MDR6939602.1 pimeloyl-ACP methyl ester carboxylesterase [Arcanobacterium hippocoleae]
MVEKITQWLSTLAPKYLAQENLKSNAPHKFPGYHTIEYQFQAPLDFSEQYFAAFQLSPSEQALLPPEITVFAREYIGDGGENLPRLVYFQGGPGSAGTRPAPMGGWMQEMLSHYRIVMLDERGTGLSHAMDALRISGISSVKAQAAYLACFRADHIVADAELLRRLLQDSEKWSALGQSFGGFCLTSYLSLAPGGLRQAFITAGLPSTVRHADDVYLRTWESLEQRNAEYFRQFPEDERTCWEIVEHLAEFAEYLPTGERLTPRRFRMLGITLGRSFGFEKMHYLLENPFIEINPQIAAKPDSAASSTRRLSSRFLTAVNAELSFADTPLYWTLHETIYAQSNALCASGLGNDGSAATAWSAQRVREAFPQFRLPDLSDGARGEAELRKRVEAAGFGFRFSCEHVFSWQGSEDPALQGLAPATEFLAGFEHFPPLHLPEVLAENNVPVKAWIYQPDMFVPDDLSLETAKQIRGLQPLISETFHHDALHTHTKEIISAFIADENRNQAAGIDTENI